MEIKCIVCDGEAEYIYYGKSLCGKHFDELVISVKGANKKMEEKKDERKDLQ